MSLIFASPDGQGDFTCHACGNPFAAPLDTVFRVTICKATGMPPDVEIRDGEPEHLDIDVAQLLAADPGAYTSVYLCPTCETKVEQAKRAREAGEDGG